MAASTTILCARCGGTAGCDPNCPECLKFLVEQGANEVDEAETERIMDDAERWAERKGKFAPTELLERVRVAVALIRDWSRGRYRKVPWRTVASLSAALLYVVNPFDLVPDFVLGLGLLDDASVLAAVWSVFSRDLDDYIGWRQRNLERKQASELRALKLEE